MRHLAGGAATSILLVLLPGQGTGAPPPKKRKDKDEDKVAMPRHSFDTPLSYEDKLGDWFASGATLFEKERVLIHPGVAERQGFLWSKEPLLTNNFEAIFQFRVVGPAKVEAANRDQSFAFWYVHENVTAGFDEAALIKAKSWAEGMKDAGLTFAGFKSKFKGVGAVLSFSDAKKQPLAVVSGVQNDGTKDLQYWTDAPTATAKAIDFRNTLNPAQVKIVITPTSFEGHIKQSASLMWHECFKLSAPMQPGGYIGLTAWSGTAQEGQAADLVSIQRLDVFNKDSTSIGEEMKDVSREIQDAYKEMLTDERRHFRDQKSQTEHLQRLVKMLAEHQQSSKPAEQKLFQELEALQNRMNTLDEDCKTLTKEVNVIINGNGIDKVGSVKDEIIGIRRIFIKESATHRKKIDSVHKDVTEMKSARETALSPETFAHVAKQTEQLEKTVKSRTSQSSLLMFVIIGSVLSIGLLMWKRMRYYEKRHFL